VKLAFFPLLGLISAAILSCLPAADRCQPMPPRETILGARMNGCSIRQAPEPDTYWYVRVWSESAQGVRWEKFYSARPPDELRKALSDCDRWLECVRRAEARLRKEPAP
jgi:hypothetical protein